MSKNLKGYKHVLRTRQQQERIESIKSFFLKFGIISGSASLLAALYFTPEARRWIAETSSSAFSSISQRVKLVQKKEVKEKEACEREEVKEIVEKVKTVPAQRDLIDNDLCEEQFQEIKYKTYFYPDGKKAVERMKKIENEADGIEGVRISHTPSPDEEPHEAPRFQVEVRRKK